MLLDLTKSNILADHRPTFRIFITPSYFGLQMRWLRAVTRITYRSKLIRISSFAAFLKHELFWGFYLIKSPFLRYERLRL
ncbi:hypothetical protein CKQ54_17830 [Rahnella variigena]|uniref:Uncharacterized protein n=1 Tax=Rahnella variigena TaxID=574964 RepID=A0ABX9PYI6_9GAMM|nr:hypothetical protein CKQ54_17830 [Rahnella variigena]